MTDMRARGWIIHTESDGFQNVPAGFGSIAKYLCTKDDQLVGFAFAISLFEKSVNQNLGDNELIRLTKDKIKEYLSKNTVKDRDELTFIFESNHFREDPNAKWWNKTL